MRAACRSGMSADDAYISKLWCFNELAFLLHANDEIRGQSNLELNDSLSEMDCSLSSEKAKRSRLDEAAELRQSAKKSMELVTTLMQKRSTQEETKEDIFCKMLSSELKQLKLAESYDNVTTEMLLMVRRAKAAERERLAWLPREGSLYSEPCTSAQSSLQSSAPQSSMSSLDEYNDDSLHNSTLVWETSGIESLDNDEFVEEGEDCIQNLGETSVEIQSVEIVRQSDILQQAFESILN